MPGATCPTPKVNTHPRSLSPQQHSRRSSVKHLPVNSHSSSLVPTLPPPPLLCLSYPLLETLFPSYLTAVGAWTFTDVITPTNVYKRTVMTHIADVPRTWIFATSEAILSCPRHAQDEDKTTEILQSAKLTPSYKVNYNYGFC